MPNPPFVEPGTLSLDFDALRREAIPITALVALFGGLALVPFAVGFTLAPSELAVLFAVLGQLVLAVGAAMLLLYVVTRAIQLSGE
jgi:hypothetical protein